MNLESLILGDMPDGLNDLEKARYIYLKLAFYLNFSTKYNNTDRYEFAVMSYPKTDVNKFNKNQIICKEWASIYSYLLNKVGVNNKIISSHHAYVVFEYNNKLWVADATYGTYTDLSRIRYGDHTDHFGICSSQDIDKTINTVNYLDSDNAMLEEIDKKFNFYLERKEYLKKLQENIGSLKEYGGSTLQKMENFFELFGVLGNGYYESKDFVKHTEYDFLTTDDKKNVRSVELKRTNKNKEVDIVQCIYVRENSLYNYFLLAPNTPIVKVDKNEIIKLAALGYAIDDGKQIAGIDFPRKFKVGVPTKKAFIYKLNKRFVPSKIVAYDKPQFGPLK